MANRTSYSLKKQLILLYLSRQTKYASYKAYAYLRKWNLAPKKKEENMLRTLERKILRRIYGQIK
jgi:hypothetical protein